MVSVAVATGLLTLSLGTGWSGWALTAHALAGLAGLGLVGKRAAHPRRWTAGVATGLVGLAAALGVSRRLAMTPPLTVHASLGVVALVAVFAVSWRRKRRAGTRSELDVERRRALRAAVVLGGAALASGAIEGLSWAASLPGGNRRFTGSHERGSHHPDDLPATLWLTDSVPVIDTSRWRLRIHQGTSSEWDYERLAGFRDHVRAVLDCTSGWYSVQDWEGVRLDHLVPAPGSARSLLVRSTTGYERRFPITDLPHLLVATRLGGEPLDPAHGYPARLVAPGRRGFWWVKWVSLVATSDLPWWWQPPFPLS